jgi:hypothetical protein
MNNGNAITRRAAMVGAASSTAAVAIPVAALVKPATIDELAMRFRDEAMSLARLIHTGPESGLADVA